ncbi:hypothetical protein ACQ86K_33270 [Mucilaginibacter sp. P19]|uniref:hypothetical protein n=1 Tax=Mucilaginibacter sp. P19 TaxID=3423947 RepID=UPI003D67BB92
MENFTMLQFFEWYYPAGGRLWNQLKNDAENLKKKGIDSVWLPPAYKAASGGSRPGTMFTIFMILASLIRKVRSQQNTAQNRSISML